MNKIIDGTWTYKMEILPTPFDGTNLTYKFPLRIGITKAMRDDVSESSSSMLEMIDLAFRVVLIQQLKLTHLPLFLDEYGSGFDYAHRLKAIDEIVKLTAHFKQVFFVSHYPEVYTRLPDARVVVLSKDNLFLEGVKSYNEDIKFSI